MTISTVPAGVYPIMPYSFIPARIKRAEWPEASYHHFLFRHQLAVTADRNMVGSHYTGDNNGAAIIPGQPLAQINPAILRLYGSSRAMSCSRA